MLDLKTEKTEMLALKDITKTGNIGVVLVTSHGQMVSYSLDEFIKLLKDKVSK